MRWWKKILKTVAISRLFFKKKSKKLHASSPAILSSERKRQWDLVISGTDLETVDV